MDIRTYAEKFNCVYCANVRSIDCMNVQRDSFINRISSMGKEKKCSFSCLFLVLIFVCLLTIICR